MGHVPDFTWLVRAKQSYTGKGYKYIDVPWMVSKEAVEVTLPKQAQAHQLTDGRCLVGSAEQSFIELMLQGKLPAGKFQTITPCFRHDTNDELHQETFYKLELIDTSLPCNEMSLLRMLIDARNFFYSYRHNVTTVKTDEGYDLKLNDVEVGSYGIRTYKDFTWVYGTGLAEPRFGIACSKYWT